MTARTEPASLTAVERATLQENARQVRRQIITMLAAAGSGHPGGSLSAADLITYLYFRHMRIDPANPSWEDRDRFVLSKGHCSPVVYAALAERGYFPKDVLLTLRAIESQVQGHPDMRKTPGIDITTGSLGQGFACAAGMALGARMQGKHFRVYSMVGDGEIQEGVVWEAAMAAVHFRLDNLIAIVDNNRQQTDGFTADVMGVEPVEKKWEGFGWAARRINGHDFDEIAAAVQWACQGGGLPHVIVADTVKGKGIREMENNPAWHALSKPLSPEQTAEFLRELSE